MEDHPHDPSEKGFLPDRSAREAHQQELLYYNRERNLGPAIAENERRRLLIEEISQQKDEENEWIKQFPFGNVVKPVGDSLLDHKRVLENSGLDAGSSLAFSSNNYPAFDAIIMQECGLGQTGVSLSPAFNPNHPSYKDYAPLRRNIAILRNYLLVQYFPDGAYIPNDPGPAGVEDAENLKKIEEMAHKLGKALAKGTDSKSWLIPRFCRSLWHLATGQPLSTPNMSDFVAQANLPDTGLEVMYDLLFSKKEAKDSWRLPPRDDTPFSDANLQRYGHSSALESCAEHIEETVRNFNDVSTLGNTQKVIAVEEGKNILDKLRLLLAPGMDGTEINEISDPELTKAINITNQVSSMQADLAMLTQQDPHDRMNIRLMEEGKALAGQASQEVRAMAGMAATQEKAVKPTATAQKLDDKRNIATAQRTNVANRAQGTQVQQHRHHEHNRRQTAQRQVTTRQQAAKPSIAAIQPTIKPAPPVQQNAAQDAAKAFALSKLGDTMSGDTNISAAGAAAEAQRAALVQAAQQATARREAHLARQRANQAKLKAQVDAANAANKKAPPGGR